MNTALMFSKESDEWTTPPDLFAALDREFAFTVDGAATADNHLLPRWFGPGGDAPDALRVSWRDEIVFLNPPYSQVRAFIGKAALEAACFGCVVVALVPARTDTRWFHEHVWDHRTHAPRPHVDVRFLKGRLKFGNSPNSAPFPSCVVIFGADAADRIASEPRENHERSGRVSIVQPGLT